MDGDTLKDDDESSSNLSFGNDFKAALEEFREKWQNELKSDEPSSSQNLKPDESSSNQIVDKNRELSVEERAMDFFLQGVEMEKKRKVFEAMQFYRKAVQLVPDIEYKFYEANQNNLIRNNNRVIADTENTVVDETENEVVPDGEDEDDENLENVDMVHRFQLKLSKSKKMFERKNANDKMLIVTSTHFSDLPTEVILHILRWVVSSDLDLKSLERFSTVCRGFYLLARDPEIWRQVCLKVWGVNILDSFDSWRDMYINRSRVHFHGCYISRNTYMRYGENSFQDQFYRPVQIVEYYRYFRFFPNGKILMYTSTEDPQTCVAKLRHRHPHQNDILKGSYRLIDDNVIIVVQRNGSQSNSKRKVRQEVVPQTFYLEFNIVSSSKKSFSQLHWKQYSLVQVRNQQEETTVFDLVPQKFSPFYFSRVKSYHLKSEGPLK